MTTDRDLADLLGETPRASDPAFRVAVLARAALQGRRRAARHRAIQLFALCAALGLMLAALPTLTIAWADVRPLSLVAGALVFAFAFAAAAIEGPSRLWGWLWAQLRASSRGALRF